MSKKFRQALRPSAKRVVLAQRRLSKASSWSKATPSLNAASSSTTFK